jgi:hypothetical protein
LKKLDISKSRITTKPDPRSWSLTNLRCLYIYKSRIPGLELDLVKRFVNYPEEYLSTLIQHWPFLGALDAPLESQSNKVGYALACNRARSRTRFRKVGKEFLQTMKLWPMILSNAKKAFKVYPDFGDHSIYHIKSHEAVHWLLLEGMEFFLMAIVERTFRRD